MSKLKIADDFALPADAVTQTFAVLAKRGVGKSYTASVMAEEMLKAGQCVIALDPTGAWWGLRSDFPVIIFGGEHADVPLEESAGEVVARAIVENRFSAVIDLSLFRKGQMIRFMVAFAETLYRLNREAVHLFVDEADAVAPQAKNYGGDENRMLGAMEDIARRGRKRGIGCTLITQRPAVLNKNVLTQCEALVALRLVHPLDIKAIQEWVNVHADPDTAGRMIADLPSLPVGDAWFWAPAWDLFRRVHVRKRETFDSGATPKPGEAAKRPRKLADVDKVALGEQIKATVEKAKADDPKELKRVVADLRKQLAAKPGGASEADLKVAYDRGVAEEQGRARDLIREMTNVLRGHGAAIMDKADQFFAFVDEQVEQHRAALPPVFPSDQPRKPAATPKPAAAPRRETPPADGLTAPQQRILDTVLMLDARGIRADRDCVARWMDLHPNGGSYGANLGHLRSQGYLADKSFQLTDLGRRTARAPETGLDAALAALPDEPKRRIVRAVVEAGASGLSRDELAERLNLHPNGGSYGANLGWLRTMGLITERGPIAATEGLHR